MFLLVSILIVLPGMLTSFAADEAVNVINFPDLQIRVTGDVDVDTSTALYLKQQLSLNGFVSEGEEGIHWIKYTKTGATIHVTTVMKMFVTEDGEEAVAIADIETQEPVDSWILEKFLDTGTPYFQNSTDQTDAWAFTSDFSSITYQYMCIDRMRSRAAANSTITITYADSLSANISDSADVTNTTLFNAYLASEKFNWWRLDLKTANSSRPYILHMAFDEIACTYWSIFSLPADQDFRDTRYSEIFLGSSLTAIDITDLSTLENQILAEPIFYTNKVDASDGLAVGWETESDLEDDTLQSWADQLEIDVSAIDNYNITGATAEVLLDAAISTTIYDTITNEKALSSDLPTYLGETKESTIKTFTLTTELSPKTLKESTGAEDVTDVSNAVIAGALSAKGRSTSFATNILTKICLAAARHKITKPFASFIIKTHEKLSAYGLSDGWILAIIIAGALFATIVVVLLLRWVIMKF